MLVEKCSWLETDLLCISNAQKIQPTTLCSKHTACHVLVVLHCTLTLSFHILGGRGARGGELVGMSRVSAGLLSHISLAGQQSLPGCVRVKGSCSKVIIPQACACNSA